MSTRSASAVPTQSMGFSHKHWAPTSVARRVQTPRSCLMSSAPGTGANTGRPGFLQPPVDSGSVLEEGAAHSSQDPRPELCRMGRTPTASLGKTQQSAALMGSGKLSSRKGLVTILDFILATFMEQKLHEREGTWTCDLLAGREATETSHTASTTAIRTHPPTLPGALLSFDLCNNVSFPVIGFHHPPSLLIRTLFWGSEILAKIRDRTIQHWDAVSKKVCP